MSAKATLRTALLSTGPTGRAFGEARYRRMRSTGISPELTAALSLLSAGDTVIDVGAAKGGYAFAFADVVGRSGRVIACEPNPTSFAELATTTWGTCVDARQCGVGSDVGELTLYVPRATGTGIDAGLGTFTGAVGGDGDDETITVPVTTIDELASELTALRLIKIDVEGWELEVLRGAQRTVQRLRPILVVECERRHLQKIGELEERFFEWADRHRYGVSTIGHPDLEPRKAFAAQDGFHGGGATSYFSGAYPNNFLLRPAD